MSSGTFKGPVPSWGRPRPVLVHPKVPASVHPTGVVVVDPDPATREWAKNILTSRGYRTVSTDDPGFALTCVRQGSVDLLLIDLGLDLIEIVPRWERRQSDPPPLDLQPVPAGYAVLRVMGRDPESVRFHAVLIKGHPGPADHLPAPRFALVDFVGRPLAPSGLLAAVEAALPAPASGEEGDGFAGTDTASVLTPHGGWPSQSRTEMAEASFVGLPKPLLKALVVDADPGYRQFLRGLLEPHGFKVHQAASGHDGIRAVLRRRPWLILTDVNMPGMDGFEFCRRVRSHSLLRHTPLVFLSEWDDYGERYHGLKLGANDYLSKRMPAREILIRLQLVLKRYSDVGTPALRGSGMEGGIELIGPTGLLQMCHLGHFSGLCTVRTGMLRIRLRFRDGEIIGAESTTQRGAEAVFELLSWTSGHFDLSPGDPGRGKPITSSFEYLLLEGCRQLDEKRRGA